MILNLSKIQNTRHTGIKFNEVYQGVDSKYLTENI